MGFSVGSVLERGQHFPILWERGKWRGQGVWGRLLTPGSRAALGASLRSSRPPLGGPPGPHWSSLVLHQRPSRRSPLSPSLNIQPQGLLGFSVAIHMLLWVPGNLLWFSHMILARRGCPGPCWCHQLILCSRGGRSLVTLSGKWPRVQADVSFFLSQQASCKVPPECPKCVSVCLSRWLSSGILSSLLSYARPRLWKLKSQIDLTGLCLRLSTLF